MTNYQLGLRTKCKSSILFILIYTISILQPSIQIQFPQSPCPGIFSYEQGEPDNDRWYGDITLRINKTVDSSTFNITLDRPSQLLVFWSEPAFTTNNILYVASLKDAVLDRGSVHKVKLMVKFDKTLGIPLLKTIHFNSVRICPPVSVALSSIGDTYIHGSRPDPTNIILNSEQRDSTVRPSIILPGLTNGENWSTTPQTTVILPDLTNGEKWSTTTQTAVILPGFTNGENWSTTPQTVVNNRVTPRPGTLNSGTQTGNNFGSNSGGTFNQGTDFNQQSPSGGNNFQNSGNFNQGNNNRGSGSGTSTGNFNQNSGNNFNKNNENQFGSSTPASEVTCGSISVANPLITNGQKAHHGQWPWHVALYKTEGINLSYLCGGSLISKNKIITAAHCLVTTPGNRVISPKSLIVYLGKYNLRQYTGETGVQAKDVARLNVNPQYNSTNFHGDIAVLTLSSDVEYSNYVRPVCVWEARNNIEDVEGKEGIVPGWGLNEYEQTSEELKTATLPVVSNEKCLRSYPKFYSEYMSENAFCAGFQNGTSPCNGDSGGGLVIKRRNAWYLRGIVSLSVAKEGLNFCDPNYYVIFTDIAKYSDFINRNYS